MRKWMVTVAALLASPGLAHCATTFNKDVAPILFRRCISCHHPGDATLFSLSRYSDAKKRAAQIAAVTQSGYMPPWLPEPGLLPFADEQRLTPAEKATLARWVQDGAPEGDHADLPPSPALTDGWQLGPPDLILTAAQPFTIPADGPDLYRNFILPVPFSGTRFVRVVQIRPGDRGIVHHANLLIDRNRSLRWRDHADGQPGFPGMDLEIPASLSDPESHFLFWKPGSVVAPEPPGMAWSLAGGSDLVLNVHIQPSGRTHQIQPSVGLYFTAEPPRRLPLLVQMENDRALNIPPGDRRFVVSDEFTLPVDAELLAIYPHAHYLGREVHAAATLPDGVQETLLDIRHWDVNWQGVYRYAKPIALPKGTRIAMQWTYDNSAANPANPNHPPKQVKGGNQSTDEMAHLWLQLLPRGDAEGRLAIQEAVARARLNRDPDDFGAHFNLGGILQARRQPNAAIREFQQAVRLKPGDEAALNALGALLQLKGEIEEASALYLRALASRPTYADAHYNLATILLAEDQPDEGIAHLRSVMQIDPDDARARTKLTGALESRAHSLAASGRLAEAAADLTDLIALNPGDSDAHANLGVTLARQGNFKSAAQALERSLQLDPRNEAARRNLERVRQHLP